MAWIGYYTYDGTEIINVERTEAYVQAAQVSWGMKSLLGNGSLRYVLQEEYNTPLTDSAPWTDPDRMESFDFYGVYPLSVAGLEDSTREATVTQFIRDGGGVGRLRHATRSAVFSVALLGATEAAVDYGMGWLKSALLGRKCEPLTGCAGAELTYFASEPLVDPNAPPIPDDTNPVYALLDGGSAAFEVDDPDVDGGNSSTAFSDAFEGGFSDTEFPIILTEPYPEPFVAEAPTPNPDPTGCLTTMERHLREVKVIDGPEITAKRYLSDGSVIWTVTFTAVAGNPFEYGRDRLVIDGFLGADTTDPFGPGITGSYDSTGEAHADPDCPVPTFEPLYDPLCETMSAPPGPVDIPAGCFAPRDDWWRRSITISDELIPEWASVVPVFGVTAQYEDLREVRIRLYPDLLGTGEIDDVQCKPVADLMVTYVPQGLTLVIDGVREMVYAVNEAGVARRADSLVFSSDGKPIMWPELSCGYGYVATVDTTTSLVFPALDLSLVAKAA